MGFVAALDARPLVAENASADYPEIDDPGTVSLALRINGKEYRLRVDPRTTLLDCLRETVALTLSLIHI